MSEDDKNTVALCSLITVLILLVAFAAVNTGKEKARDQLQQEAIKAGVARWIPDADGKPKFEWIKPAEQEPVK